ncbi:MAG: Pr6Pr family membrane protein [Ferruginibacter sp.]
MKKDSIFLKLYQVVLAVVTWFALGVQLKLMLDNAPGLEISTGVTILNYLSFFTILTNLLVAASLTAVSFMPSSAGGIFFRKPGSVSAIAVYISIVGIVYSIALRKIWDPQGWQLIADRLLHDVVPVLYVVFWWLAVPKKTLQWKSFLLWLIYPLTYLIYAIVRGIFTGWYAYPFLDVKKIGWGMVALNVMVITSAFCLVSLLFIFINRKFLVRSNGRPLQ